MKPQVLEANGDQLLVERLPGQFGPVLRCFGQLTQMTAEILERELDRVEPMRHAVLTVNLSGCDFADLDGITQLLKAYRRLREDGRRLALVASGGIAARLLQVLGIDLLIPVFPKEEVAAKALRGGGPPAAAPATWKDAREKSVQRWQVIGFTLRREPEEALRMMTSMFAICDLSEKLFVESAEPALARCQFCPLFHALGCHAEDVGCRSALDPIIDAVRSADFEGALARISTLTDTIRRMPLPHGTQRLQLSVGVPEQPDRVTCSTKA